MQQDYHWLNDRLATGGDLHMHEKTAIRQIMDLERAGVTHILDVREEWSDEALVAQHVSSITYLHLPADDHGRAQPAWWWKRGTEWARDELLGDPNARLLVHCHMGVNRGPSMAFAILVDTFGMDPVEAFKLIRTKRPDAYAIYALDGLSYLIREDTENIDPDDPGTPRWTDPDLEIIRLRTHIQHDHTMDDIRATIGRKRAMGL